MGHRINQTLAVALSVIASAAASAQPAAVPAVDEASIVELGRLVARTLPIDIVFQSQIDKEPNWPLMGKAANVPPAKLACTRKRLAPAGFLETRTEEARQFAKRSPDRVESSIRVLAAGGADMSHAYFVAGGERSQRGMEIDDKEIAARFTPAQLSAFVELANASEHMALRRLVGMPDYASDRVAEILDKRPSGDIRATISRIMLGAMSQCDISLADIR